MDVVASKATAATPPPATDGLADTGLYTVREVSRLLQLPERKLRYWSQTGFILPSARRGGRALYSFRDLIAIKVAKGLLEGGLPLRRVRRQLAELRSTLPGVDTPLANLRIRCEHDRVVVLEQTHRFEAATGQLVLDFEVDKLRDEAAKVLALPWVAADGKPEEDQVPESAYEWFLYASELEDQWGGAPADTAGFEAARHAYEQALRLDPALAAAWTNLGGMLAESGDFDGAQDCFEQALRLDDDLPQARSNLAELHLRRGEPVEAITAWKQLLEQTPDHFEAHYGLSRALLEVGNKEEALAHLLRFCHALDAMPPDEADLPPELLARYDSALAVIAELRAELRTGPV